MPLETRIFVGEPNTVATEGWAGFSVGKCYHLHVEYLPGGSVVVQVASRDGHGPVVLTGEQWAAWFKHS